MVLFVDNLEFIKNRSFEIAWAVFRCANLIKQPILKFELEKASIELVAGLRGESVENLEKLEQLIRLAEAVGEINKSNAFVLFREVDNLKEVIRQRNLEIRQLEEEKENLAIDDIFAKIPAQIPIFGVNNALKTEKDKENSANSANSAEEENEEENAKIQDFAAASLEDSAIYQNVNKNDDFLAEDRQQMILKKIKEFGKTTTKELTAVFPEISERTIRAHLQRLCEQGAVARVGISGPGSYYVAR